MKNKIDIFKSKYSLNYALGMLPSFAIQSIFTCCQPHNKYHFVCPSLFYFVKRKKTRDWYHFRPSFEHCDAHCSKMEKMAQSPETSKIRPS